MKRRTRWLIFAAVMGLAACQLPFLPADPAATATARATATAILTATAPATALISGPATNAVPTATPGAQPMPDCTWFFTFRAGMSEPGCPEPAVVVDAVGQDFVGGRVYRYGQVPGDPDQRDTVFVIYNDGTWESYADTFAPGDQTSDPSIIPPAGRFQPTGAIGKVWRENQAVRRELGWAYAQEQPFTGRYQNPQGDSHNIYVDHGKGLVLRLVSVNLGSWTWDVAGDY